MVFNFKQEVHVTPGVSQKVGFLARQVGSRTAILTESLLADTKEVGVVTQSLQRAQVQYLVLEYSPTEGKESFIQEALSMVIASHADSMIVLGSQELIHLGRIVYSRYIAVEKDQEPRPELCIQEIPTTFVFPYLFSPVALGVEGYPPRPELIDYTFGKEHLVLMDPLILQVNTPVAMAGSLFQLAFGAFETLLHITSNQVALGAATQVLIQSLQMMGEAFEQPGDQRVRQKVLELGLALGIARSHVPLTLPFSSLLGLPMISDILPYSWAGPVFPAFVERFGESNHRAVDPLVLGLGFNEVPSAAVSADKLGGMVGQFGLPGRLKDLGFQERDLESIIEGVRGEGHEGPRGTG
jgi:hypothetical protein